MCIRDREETGLLPARQGGWAGILSAQISSLIAVLCTLFPLDTGLLSGHAAKGRGFVEQVDAQVKQRLSEQAPEVRRADLPHRDLSALLAERIRKNVLCAGDVYKRQLPGRCPFHRAGRRKRPG